MVTHTKAVHRKVKDIECMLCDKRFVLRARLVNHVRMVHFKREVQCNICDRLYGSNQALDRHTKSKHDNENLETLPGPTKRKRHNISN